MAGKAYNEIDCDCGEPIGLPLVNGYAIGVVRCESCGLSYRFEQKHIPRGSGKDWSRGESGAVRASRVNPKEFFDAMIRQSGLWFYDMDEDDLEELELIMEDLRNGR